MQALVSFLTRRRSGNVGTRNHEVSSESLRFGRSTDAEAYLPDPRIRLHHATLHIRPHGLFFEAAEQVELIVDGQATRAATVKPGDRIGLGPYEIVILDPPPGKEVAVTVELVRQLGDDLQKLQARSRTDLRSARISKRGWAWGLAAVVLGLFLVWPIATHFAARGAGTMLETPRQVARMPARMWPLAADLAWDTGEMSGPHKFFGDQCSVCHQKAFVTVQDSACVACHADIQHHADPAAFKFPELTDGLCQSCHKEHNGREPIVRDDQAFCAGCHRKLKALASRTELLDAADFGDDHPQFRPAVVVDAAADKRVRMTLDPTNWPVERANFKFSHKAHLKAAGVRMPDRPGLKVMECGNCHRAEPGGVGMQPIDMKRDCAACHLLKFEPTAPDRVVPHGDATAVLHSVRSFYAETALRGAVQDPAAPAILRRRAGKELTVAERLEALSWAEMRAEQAGEYQFGKAVCGVCHEVTRSGGDWDVKPVKLADRWLSKGLFDHGRHDTMACVECHKASVSKAASDVLLPGIENCQQCHGGEQAADRVPSTCITCHEFHQPSLGPMRPNLAKATSGAK